MTQGDELFVSVGGRDVGLQAVLQKVDAEMKNSADQAVRLGQQYARLAQAQGQPRLASQILAGTIQQAGSASERALIGVETQAARAANSSNLLRDAAQQAGGGLGQMASAATPVAAAFGAFQLAKQATEFAAYGQSLDQTRQSFDALARSGNTTGDALLASMNRAAAGTIADADLIKSANTGLLLTSGKIATELPRLIEIARASAKATGQDIGFIFDSLTRGIARGSPQIIDNASITLDAAGAFETYAKSIGKSSDQLTKAEQQQATLNAVIAAGNDIIAKTGGAADSGATGIARLGTVFTNTKNAAASFYGQGLGPIAGGLADVATGTDGTAAGFGRFAASVQSTLGVLQGYGATTGVAAQANQEFATSVAQGVGNVLSFLGIVDQAAAAQQLQATATQQNAAAQQQAAAAILVAADADERRTAAALTAAQVTQDEANASLFDAAAKKTQAAQTALLNFQTQQAAQAFLALNPNISQSGVAAAVASGQISAAVGQYIAMTLATARARAELANLQAQAGVSPALRAAATAAGGGDVGRYITTPVDPRARAEGEANVARLRELNAQEKAHADAVRDATLTTGTAAQKQNLLNKEYQDASRIYGQNSTQAIKAKTALDQYAQSQAKAAGGGGGGKAKLSDQQKLEGALLTDQEKYQQQSEDAASTYARDVEKIYQDYYEKMRQAQRDFDQDQLEGRASFYDNLGSIEGKNAGKIQQQASAAYEAASIEAGKIAQEKGADVADKYMSAQEQIISARAKRQAAIEQAAQDKDNARAEYLKGVDAQYRAAEDAKLSRIKEGEGSIAAERDKQLDEAAAKESDAQEKIATASDRATERKIANADRAGKKIDEEQAKLTALGQTYDRLAPARGTQTTSNPPATTTPTPAPTTTAPAEGENPVVTALNAAKDAVVAAVNAVERASKETTGAVKGLRATGGIAG